MQRVLLGSTDTIVSYPRLMRGNRVETSTPSTVTARRVCPLSSDIETAYVAATVDGATGTTTAGASEGATSIVFDSSVSVVGGQQYLLIDATTLNSVIVKALRSQTSITIHLAEPLPCDIAGGTDITGLAVSVALTAAQTAQVGPGYVLFRGTVDSGVVEWDEAFRVVRRITSIAMTVTELTQIYPVARKLSSSSDTTLEESIEASWRAVVVPLLAAKGILDEDVITDDVLVPLHAIATVLHLARQWPQSDNDYVARLEASYEQTKATTFARIDLAVRGQEETPDVPVPGFEPRIQIRLTR